MANLSLGTILLVLFAVSLAGCSLGWLNFIYFISLGYGLAIALQAVSDAVMFHGGMTLSGWVICIMLFLYGVRLFSFLLVRQLKSASYNKAVMTGVSSSPRRPFRVSLMIWISCAMLYLAQASPAAFRLERIASGAVASDVSAWIGIALMIAGLCLESAADAQKSAAKKKNPHRFVDTGLYRIVRCPNYLGELVFWTGCFVTMFGIGARAIEWVIALVGYMGIAYVMFSGTRRLEIKQNSSYGDNPEYREYVKKTPILLPLVPLYSLEKHSWLKG